MVFPEVCGAQCLDATTLMVGSNTICFMYLKEVSVGLALLIHLCPGAGALCGRGSQLPGLKGCDDLDDWLYSVR